MKIWRNVLFVFLGLVLFSNTAKAHPYHVSIAEVKYNNKTQALEISLKLFTDDLEKTLSEGANKPILLNQSAEVQLQVEQYLKTNFRLELSQDQVVKQKLVGFEKQDDAHWFYLEIPVKANQLKSAKLRNQVLVKTFPDQTNLTNLEIGGEKRTLIFREGEVVKALF